MCPVSQRRELRTVYVLLTMDCETARSDLTPCAIRMSGSGPSDYRESERSIRAYVETAATYDFPVTLFTHPEVASGMRTCFSTCGSAARVWGCICIRTSSRAGIQT